MKYKNVVIESFAYDLPEDIMTSDQIELEMSPLYDRLNLPYGRLELMTGIKERRFYKEGTLPSDLSTKAANYALEKSNISRDQIDILIHSSVCRNFLEPATASVVHRNLELSNKCNFFDLSNACLGVLNAFDVVANMIEAGTIQRALVVTGENGGPLLKETLAFLGKNKTITRKEIKKYFANLTIGSAACAFILCHKDISPNSPELLGRSILSDSSANHLCSGDGNPNSLMMETDSEKLMERGILLAKQNWAQFKNLLDWMDDTADCLITHQVGMQHQNLLYKELGIDIAKDYSTYSYLGNTGSAALPITMIKAFEEGRISKGARVALLGIGSGLSSIMMGVKG